MATWATRISTLVMAAGLVGIGGGAAGADPSATDAPSAGSVKIAVDGRPQDVRGSLVCRKRSDGATAISIHDVFGVVISEGSPPVVHAVVFPHGGPIDTGMQFNDAVPGTGQATANKDGGSYRITGVAEIEGQNDYATKSFEIDVTCPAEAPTAPTAAAPAGGTPAAASSTPAATAAPAGAVPAAAPKAATAGRWWAIGGAAAVVAAALAAWTVARRRGGRRTE